MGSGLYSKTPTETPFTIINSHQTRLQRWDPRAVKPHLKLFFTPLNSHQTRIQRWDSRAVKLHLHSFLPPFSTIKPTFNAGILAVKPHLKPFFTPIKPAFEDGIRAVKPHLNLFYPRNQTHLKRWEPCC